MAPTAVTAVLITGATSGIGRELARQLGMRDDVRRVLLAGRDEGRLRETSASLRQATGRSIYETLLMDVSEPDSVRTGVRAVGLRLDAVVLNAGGTGGPTPFHLTLDGVTHMFASNVVGHVVLLEGLLAAGALTGTALYVGSEAARGSSKIRVRRPVFATSSADEFATVIDGSFFRDRKPDVMLHYAQVKYLGALWMAALSRRHPDLRLVTVSPGQTSGTRALRDQHPLVRALGDHLLFPYVLPALGLAHPVAAGAGRLLGALTDDVWRSGVFYASDETAMIGPMIDQAGILPDLHDRSVQDAADEAIHRFV